MNFVPHGRQSTPSAAKADATPPEKAYLRDELCVVVALLGKQLAPPAKEGPKGRVRVLGDFTLIPVRPYLQAHEGNPDVQGSVKLPRHRRARSSHRPA